MGEQDQGGKWIAPEDVPDPIALRGHSVARVPSTPPPSRVELGTLDPLDPPSLEVVQVARAAETKLWEAAEPTDFSLDPTPPPAAPPTLPTPENPRPCPSRTPRPEPCAPGTSRARTRCARRARLLRAPA